MAIWQGWIAFIYLSVYPAIYQSIIASMIDGPYPVVNSQFAIENMASSFFFTREKGSNIPMLFVCVPGRVSPSLVGGPGPPPLKNMTNRQLGWSSTPNIHGKMPNWWQPFTTNQPVNPIRSHEFQCSPEGLRHARAPATLAPPSSRRRSFLPCLNGMGVFYSLGVPKMVGLSGKILLEFMIWGYCYLRKPHYRHKHRMCR